MECWSPILDFPDYLVSDEGFVRHYAKDKDLTIFENKSGSTYVSLSRNNKTYNRSISRLVAETFLEDPPQESFDTLIYLDGDRKNNSAKNLMWRPRWFAFRYHAQFMGRARGFSTPVAILDTMEVFPNSWEAAIKYGLIDRDILMATLKGDPVWPTGHKFLVLSEETLPAYLKKPPITL